MRNTVAALGVLAMFAVASCSRNTSPASVATVHGFPVPAGASRVCGQSVMGGDGTHIEWEIWASPLTTVELATWMRGQIPSAVVEQSSASATFRVPDANAPAHVADVRAPDATGVPRCPEPLPSGTQSVLELSSMTRATP